jgi:hypothetical protein
MTRRRLNKKDRLARFGDFSRINAEWNRAKSITTNKKITDNPELWFHYHQLFEEKQLVDPAIFCCCLERSSNHVGHCFGGGQILYGYAEGEDSDSFIKASCHKFSSCWSKVNI